MRLNHLIAVALVVNGFVGAIAACPSGDSVRTNALVAVTAAPRTDWAGGSYHYLMNEMRRAVRGQAYDFVVFGDSITMGWIYPAADKGWPGGREVWERHFGQYKTANFGVSGDRTEHVLWRITHAGQADGWTAKKIVVAIGINNLGQRKDTPAETLGGTKAIVAALRERHPESEIVVLGALPWRGGDGSGFAWVREYNRLLAGLQGERVSFCDISGPFLAAPDKQVEGLFRDGLHPNPAGYEVYAGELERALGLERDAGMAYWDLVPLPRVVERRPGWAAADAPVRHVTDPVVGASASVADQAYSLEIRPDEVVVTAPSPKGVRYAETTLAQLRKLAGGQLPCGVVRDWPEFRYRGFMLDVGRNWQPVGTIREILDFMAAYKLNLFHWHLTDYWGWRLESKTVPELNTDAATIRNVGRRYTQEEFVAVVEYAAARGITVLPEIDVPGHTEAFRRALGIASMRDPKADRALKAFFAEFAALVPPEKMPYIHLGTDEVRNEPEKVDEAVVRGWARHAAAKGHTIVGWAPGIDLSKDGIASAKMQWGAKDESAGFPFFDMTLRYIDVVDPFEILGMAAYAKPCPWDVPAGQALGALIGCWHDDALSTPDQLFTNNAVFPAIVANADAFWCGRREHRPEFLVRAPSVGDPARALAVDLERRVIAQRDRVLGAGFARPFAFVRQTDQRWRLAYADGALIAEDVPQATIRLHARGKSGCYCPRTNATVVAETWIRSPVAQTVGAWIGFTGLSRSSGRAIDSPLPDRGQWNRHGATAELNGERLAPPDWVNAGLRTTAEEMKVPHFWSFAALSNRIPWANEEYYMRPPTPIRLKKGWNHVRMTMPAPDPEPYACRHAWCMTFLPILGTSEHPREVPGLEYGGEGKGSVDE